MGRYFLLLALLGACIVVDKYSLPSVGGLSCEAKKSSSIVSNGLKNVGNTCYMNAQLQCAFHIPAVRDIATSISSSGLDNDGDDDSPGREQETSEAALALEEVVEGMIQAADQKSFPFLPRSFCMRLGIPPMVQQDSQEFWKLLLPAVGVKKLINLYAGKYEDYISATDGSGREKRRDETFLDLSLDVSTSSSLLDSLKDTFGKPELLNAAEGNGWRPEKGADQVDALKGSALLAKGLPPVLQFHLKRFDYDWNTDSMTKLNNRFTFPKSIDLASVCVDVGDNDPLSEYELQSVIIHMGDHSVGHYYAYVRPDIEGDIWYRFNDDKVDKVTFEEVINDAFGGRSNKTNKKKGRGFGGMVRRLFHKNNNDVFGWGGETSNAYVVQYVQRSNIRSLYTAQI